MKKLMLVFVALSLSACMSPTTVVTPLAEKEQGIRNIQNVSVSYSDLLSGTIEEMDTKRQEQAKTNKNPDAIKFKPLKISMSEVIKEALETRDNDEDYFADIHIEVDTLKLANPAMAILLGDTDQLAGTVRVIDPQTDKLLTEIYVDVLESSGGLLGLAIRGAGVRERLALQFGDHIGDQLGFRKIDRYQQAPQPEK